MLDSKTRLCIGGPRDGEWIVTEGTLDRLRVAQPRPWSVRAVPTDEWRSPSPLSITEYHAMLMPFGWSLWRAESLTECEVLGRLIHGYAQLTDMLKGEGQ